MGDACLDEKLEEVEDWMGEHSIQEISKALEYTSGCDYEHTNYADWKALSMALSNGASVNLVRTMITNAPQIVTITNKCDDLPLHCATDEGASEEVLRVLTDDDQQTLITKGCLGHTPLSRALYLGRYLKNAEAIELLVGNGAVAITDNDGLLPMHLAIMNGYSSEILQIISAECIKKNQKGQTPLLWAIDVGCLTDSSAVKILGANGASDITDKEGNHLLHICCMRI